MEHLDIPVRRKIINLWRHVRDCGGVPSVTSTRLNDCDCACASCCFGSSISAFLFSLFSLFSSAAIAWWAAFTAGDNPAIALSSTIESVYPSCISKSTANTNGIISASASPSSLPSSLSPSFSSTCSPPSCHITKF